MGIELQQAVSREHTFIGKIIRNSIAKDFKNASGYSIIVLNDGTGGKQYGKENNKATAAGDADETTDIRYFF